LGVAASIQATARAVSCPKPAERRDFAAPVERAQGVAHRAEAERRAAALVRDREAIAADGEASGADADLRDAAGADDQRRALGPGMRAEVGDRRIGDEADVGEGEGQGSELFAHAGAGDASNAHAGADARDLGIVQRRGGERLRDDLAQHFVEALDADPGIGRAAFAGAQDHTALVYQPAAAMAAARINAEEIGHACSLQQPGPALPCLTAWGA
jgi:hypothetical protein